jgi:hypothetical protein
LRLVRIFAVYCLTTWRQGPEADSDTAFVYIGCDLD